MTVLCWHLVTKDEDYAFARPSLNAHKRRKLELAAGAKSRRGPAAGADARLPHQAATRPRVSDRRAAERAYEVIVAHWQPQRPAANG